MGKEDQEERNRSLLGHYSLVALADKIVIGFGDMVINEQQVEREGIVLKNYVMEKYRYNNGL